MRFEYEYIACDLCGCAQYRILYRKIDNWTWINKFEFPVVECNECGLVYVNPRPTRESMEQFYPAGYHDNRDSRTEQQRYAAQFEYIRHISSGNVLDIGCARGDFLNYINKLKPNLALYGCDYYSDAVNFESIRFTRALLPECGYEDGFFSLIMAWAVFEHLLNPSEYFNKVSSILKPGGRFVMLVTNAESIYSRYAYTEDIPRHTYHFSEKTLDRYARGNRLRITQVDYTDRIFDGRGTGMFRYLFSRWARYDWQQRFLKQGNALQRSIELVGIALDKMAFSVHWEAWLRRSGIMVVTFGKPP